MTPKNQNSIDNKFESYFKNNKAVMLEIDIETNQIKDANDAAIKFYGYKKDVLLQKNMSEINTLPPEEMKLKIQEAAKNQSNFYEFKHRLANGNIKDVEVYASPFSFGQKNYMIATVYDVTEKNKYKEKLEKQNKDLAALNEEYSATVEELTEKNNEYSALNEEYQSQNEELKKAKQIAEENEAKINELANLLPQAIYECNIDGKITYVNDRAYEFFGYTPEELEKGINIFQALAPESIEKAKINIQKVLNGEAPEDPDYTALRKDGTTFPVQIYSSPVIKNNKPVGLRGVIIDTSLIKNAEKKIKQQLREIELLNSNIPTSTWKFQLDTKGKIINTYNSDVIDDFLKIPKGSVSKNWETFFNFVKPQYREELYEKIKKGFRNPGKIFSADYEVVKANGEEAWFSTKGLVIKENNKLNAYGTTIDITERKNTENELLKAKEIAEESELKFRSIFDYSPQPISISDISGVFTEVNHKLCEISGFKKEELLGKKATDIGLYSPKDRERFLNNLKKNGKAESLEFTFSDKYKNKVEALVNATFIKIKGETFILSMITDISKRKKAEEEIIKAKEKAEESDRLKTEFINNLSHEIRTPMNGILGFTQLLSSENISKEKQKNYIKIIQNSGEQLLRIIDDILEISKLETKQVKAIKSNVCLNDLFFELFSIFDIKAKENKTPLYFKKGLPDNESYIITDSSKLNKILSNLLENAFKFTNTGFVEFGYYKKENNIVIYVKDTGIGIKPEKQKVIFERFSQEDKKISEQSGGLGLGLSIAKENAELLGGSISLKSQKGKGSTFYITIPYITPKNTNKNCYKNQSGSENNYKTILIAEDEEVNYIYIETLLDYFYTNIEKIHAKNGKQAVEICKKRKDIDFILMDLKMPVMNGYEATKEIKKIRPELPIIAQTAYSTTEEKAKALQAGCDDFISKPISKEIFSKIINKYKNR